MSGSDIGQVRLQVLTGSGRDDQDLENATGALLQDLEEGEIPFQVVRQQSAGLAHTKSADQFVSAGQIILSLIVSGGVLTTLISAVQAWLLRNQGKKLIFEYKGYKLEMSGASDVDFERALSAFLRKIEQ